jgi:hypothetical protein
MAAFARCTEVSLVTMPDARVLVPVAVDAVEGPRHLLVFVIAVELQWEVGQTAQALRPACGGSRSRRRATHSLGQSPRGGRSILLPPAGGHLATLAL